MYSIILCGGSGTRLWPLSRKNFPKQFLNLYNEKSLIQETFLRMRGLMPKENIFFITNKDGLFNVYNQIKDIEPTFKKENIIVEPESKNTAPAILYALKYIDEYLNIDRTKPIFILPSDHYIGDQISYTKLMKKIASSVKDNIGIIGITPKKPETGYGYIHLAAKQLSGNYWKVVEFKEKPDAETAKKYFESGEYLWNSGKYIFTTEVFLNEIKKHMPKMHAFFQKNFEDFKRDFSMLPSLSIDHALAEKSDKMIVFKGDFIWSDIGSFDSLADIMNLSKDGNNRHICINSQNVFLHSKSGKLIVASGVDDLIVVENNDSILVQKRGESEDVKNIVKHLAEHNYKEIDNDVVVQRPWGSYEVLIDTPTHKVKKITVYPKAQLSLQSHTKRSEHWVVVKGVAGIINDNKKITLKENESAYIQAGHKHRLSNPSHSNLEIIEVQTGSYLGEDDITRYDDIYNRLRNS